MSLMQLNAGDPETLRWAYARVVPPRCWAHLEEVDFTRFTGGETNPDCFRVIAQPDKPEAHLRAPASRLGGDFAFSLDLEEAGAGQLEIGFVVVNDLGAPRFNIDVDEHGQLTLLGTAGRNLPAELAAMKAGLGPCQVRRGLGLFPELLPRLEELARQLGYVAIVLEPLTYHNAVMYENHGFGYIVGRKRMVRINQEFMPGGALARALESRTPFRAPELAHSARGRSWAIHDGILEALDGEPHLELHMVKVIGVDARQRTFELGK
jgi:hypothetical protein